MQDDPPPKRRHPNAAETRALKASRLAVFMRQYGRRAPRHGEPNDRKYDRDVEQAFRQMDPVQLDALLREDEDD